MKPTIGFIGGGNMASSLIGGMLRANINAADILVAEPDASRCQMLADHYQVHTTQSNTDTLQCECVVLAVKPQIMHQICAQLKPALSTTAPLFISIAAGLMSATINQWLGDNQAIVRCMPNTPALVQCGATAMFANKATSSLQQQQAEKILQSVGITVWVANEDQLNAVTAVSGSGPAYFFLLMEAMQQAGEKLGLETETALQLVLQTALGAARMASEKQISPATLRQQVTSKGGTTEQAINSFEASHFRNMVMQALQAANDRSISLAEELGKL